MNTAWTLAPVDAARRQLQAGMRRLISGQPGPPVAGASSEDPGLFGPDSVTWIVHADQSMLVGGVRALLLQVLHPLTMAGVADHSDYRRDPLGRLRRTGQFLGATTFGNTTDAEQAIEIVRTIHDRVTGTAPDGRLYSANDPHLLSWVHTTEVDSFLRAYQRYGAHPLEPEEADQYVGEMAETARRLGVVDPPIDRRELEAQLHGFRPELDVGDQARDAIRWLMAPPLPLAARAPYALLAGGAIGLLPRHARRMMRLPLVPGVDPLVLRPAANAMLRVLGWAMAAPSEAA